MAGTDYFQSLNDRAGLTTAIFSDIFHVNQDRPAASDHSWKLFITDYASNVKGKAFPFKTSQTFNSYKSAFHAIASPLLSSL